MSQGVTFQARPKLRFELMARLLQKHVIWSKNTDLVVEVYRRSWMCLLSSWLRVLGFSMYLLLTK